MKIAKIFSERLRAVRQRRELTQAELARRLGVAPGSVGNWEKGMTPTVEGLVELAAGLGVPAGYLLGENSGDATLARAAEGQPWKMLANPTLQSALNDLNAYHGTKETEALAHLAQIIIELRARRPAPAEPGRTANLKPTGPQADALTHQLRAKGRTR